MFLSLKLIMGHEWKPRNYFWGVSLGVVYPILKFFFVCVFIRSTIELTYFHTPKPGWHSPVDKLKQPPHRCKATIDSRVYKQVHPQTDNKKSHGFFFLCFLFLQRKRKRWGVGGDRGSGKLYAIKTPQSLDPGKAQQRDAAVPHQERRDVSYSEATWSQDTHGHFSGIHRRQRWRGLNTRITLCYFSWATRDLELLVCGLLYCILYMYIYICTGMIQFWWTKLKGFTWQT